MKQKHVSILLVTVLVICCSTLTANALEYRKVSESVAYRCYLQ